MEATHPARHPPEIAEEAAFLPSSCLSASASDDQTIDRRPTKATDDRGADDHSTDGIVGLATAPPRPLPRAKFSMMSIMMMKIIVIVNV